jgi:hypothetical protein
MKKLTLISVLTLLASFAQASVPQLGQEVIPPEEAEATKEILELVAHGYSHYKPTEPPAGRIIHHKEHGCVKAEFKILKDLPQNLRYGVFAESKTYPAWVRVSNGSGARQHDSIPDARGLAIKLMDVDGEKLLDEKKTQDFLLQSAPNFFAKDVADYVKFMKQSADPGLKGVAEMIKDINLRDNSDRKSVAILARSGDLPKNPLTANYYSALPQRLGPLAMKLHARPCPDAKAPEASLTARLKKNFLKDVMEQQLSEKDACIELLVQVQTDAVKMPIENAMVTWDPALSPFVPVAQIHIPKQAFTSEKRRDFCENISFTPWHSLEAHRPLGGLNRVRKLVYGHSQSHRHKLNNQKSFEPVSGEIYE